MLEPDGSVGDDPFLDISGRISAGGEEGLLGLAFHPEDPTRLYVHYTDLESNVVIAAYRAESPARAAAASEEVLLRIPHPYANHNGGMLAFGPDGFLHIGIGDGGSGGDPHRNGQSRKTLLGKILRIDVDGGERYASPADNPFAEGPGRPEIWHYGLRNPWRFSFDRETGDLWIGDVGQNELEEVVLAVAGRGGLNFGWNVMEGRNCYEHTDCDREGLTLPVAQYPTARGCAITGGYVYRGDAFPELRGVYLFADYCGGQIWGLVAEDAADGNAKSRKLLQTSLAISSFGEDEAGELYVTDLAGGSVYRVVPE